MDARSPEEPVEAGREDGASVFDLGELAPAARRVMRLMMRELELGYADLRLAMEQLPAGEGVNAQELDDVLAQLAGQNWLLVSGADEGRRYRVNYRRRSGRALTQVTPRRQSGRSLGKTIWEALESGSPGETPAAGGADPSGAEGGPPAEPSRKD